MDEETDLPFRKLFFRHWIWLATGSVIAAVWSFASPAGISMAWQYALSIFFLGIAVAAYLAGRDTHQQRQKLAKRFKPSFRVTKVFVPSNQLQIRGIVIHNDSPNTVKLGVRLVEIKPRTAIQNLPILPVVIEEIEVPGNSDQIMNIYTDGGPPHMIMFPVKNYLFCGPRDTGYEIDICIYQISSDGAPRFEKLYIVPSSNGFVTMSVATSPY